MHSYSHIYRHIYALWLYVWWGDWWWGWGKELDWNGSCMCGSSWKWLLPGRDHIHPVMLINGHWHISVLFDVAVAPVPGLGLCDQLWSGSWVRGEDECALGETVMDRLSKSNKFDPWENHLRHAVSPPFWKVFGSWQVWFLAFDEEAQSKSSL